MNVLFTQVEGKIKGAIWWVILDAVPGRVRMRSLSVANIATYLLERNKVVFSNCWGKAGYS